jgi:EmrB/QacA subfamily drug resistance transporter
LSTTVTESDETVVEAPVPGVTEYAARLSPNRIRITTVAVLAGMFLAAVDGTVVATSMPTVARELHGLSLYAWVATVYLLTEVATIPLWGKLADMFGRKPAFIAGMTIFLAGSVACGLSSSMLELVAFRGLQGIGAGALIPVAQTILGDLFTMEQRVRMAAVFSAVFGFASIVGPLLGGFITDNLSWRWVFYVNVPVALVAIALVAVTMVEPLTHRQRHRLDWPGLGLLLLATSLFVLALETGGREWGWLSAPIVGAFVVALVAGAGFVTWERRAPEPLVPLDLLRLPVLRPVLLATMLLTIPMYAVLNFLPLFMVVVLGTSNTAAATVLTPLMLGSIFGSMVGARLVLRFGYRPVVMVSAGFALAGLAFLTTLGVHSTRADATVAMVLCGLGMGPVFVVGTLVAQSSVSMRQRGVASSLVNFVRQLGGALGVAAAGAVMLAGVTARLAELFPGVHLKANDLLVPRDDAPSLPPAVQHGIQEAFAHALHRAFVFALVAGAVAACTALLIPKGRPSDLHVTDAD